MAEGTGLPLVATGDVHYLAPRGRARARGAALHPVRRLAEEPEPLALRHRPVLLQDPGGDGQRLRRVPGRRARGRSRSPSGATSRSSSARSGCRSTRSRRVATPSTTSSSCARRAWQALRPRHGRYPGAPQVRAEDDPRDGLRRLLPDRLGLRQLREAERRLGRPGPRLDRGLARRLLPRDHRGRPDPLRPPLRALPEPGPQVDARHGHRLLGRRPRPRHQLRRREVRARPRRPDHHLRDDDGQGGGARRGPRPRGPLRRGRQDREADPRGRRRSTSTSA